MDITQSVAPPRALAWRPKVDRYLAANLLLWVLSYTLTTLRSIGMTERLPYAGEMAVRRVFVCIAGVGICILIKQVLVASQSRSWNVRLALAALLAVAGVAAWSVINYVAFYLIAPHHEWVSSSRELFLGALMNASTIVWSFLAWCAIVLAIGYDAEARDKTLRLAQAQALAAESQNRMLRYQINPHFLFNTFNALSSLILQKDYARAEQVVLSLSGFLRASLEKDPGEKTTLAAEIDAQRQYLAIEQIRFGDRLKLSESASAEAGRALVPSFILQPLVENAVKHGVARSTAPVRIEILAEAAGGRLKVTVQDDAVPDLKTEPVRLGVGLENVRKRLALMYGEAGRLTCDRREAGGFACVIEMPLERR